MRYKLIAAAAALVLAAPAVAENWDFVLINDSGKEIKLIQLSPAGTDTWQDNKVDADEGKGKPTKTGGRTTVHFDKGDDNCKYDVKATFTDDTSTTWAAIDVCDNAFVTLRYKDGAPVFAAN